jgi:hypothetical protein
MLNFDVSSPCPDGKCPLVRSVVAQLCCLISQPQGIANECTDSSTFIQNVNWAGVMADGASYETKYTGTKSPEGCCGDCYKSEGCGGWLYTGVQFTPCAKLIITANPRRVGNLDGKCPKGYAPSTTFTVQDGSNATAGLGPCSREVTQQN